MKGAVEMAVDNFCKQDPVSVLSDMDVFDVIKMGMKLSGLKMP